MAKKDFYLILGVPRTASQGTIKKAFRRLAKASHPDRTGSQEAAGFKEIAEAYDVLSNTAKRQRYNDSAPHAGTSRKPARSSPAPRAVHPSKVAWDPARRVEPLIPTPREVEPLIPEPVGVGEDFQTIRPSSEEIGDRFPRNITGLGVAKEERPRSLDVEVVVTPQEARRGAPLTLYLPVFSPCPACGGSGHAWLSPCHYCLGRGVIEEREAVHVKLPGMTRHGIVELSLARMGLPNLFLRVHVRISSNH